MARPDQYVAARSSKPASETASTKALVRSGVMAMPAARRTVLKPTSSFISCGGFRRGSSDGTQQGLPRARAGPVPRPRGI